MIDLLLNQINALTSIEIFILGVIASALIVLLDFESGISLKLPSGRRLGFAGLVLAAATGYSFVIDNGVTGFILAIRAEIFSVLILAVVAGYVLRRNGVL